MVSNLLVKVFQVDKQSVAIQSVHIALLVLTQIDGSVHRVYVSSRLYQNETRVNCVIVDIVSRETLQETVIVDITAAHDRPSRI